MSGTRFATIADVSRTVVDLLKTQIGDSNLKIALASPKNPGNNELTLFLYKLTPNADLNNADRRFVPGPNGTLAAERASLVLDAYYMLTAHASDPTRLGDAHRALSLGMRVFHDHGIVSGSLLRADSPSHGLTADSLLRITLTPITMEDMTRIWSVFPDTPYEISVSYLVTPVEIESALEVTGAPVVDQVHKQGQAEPALETVGS
jgi:Pvc16 N-terminal domain